MDVCWNYLHDGIRARAILIKIAEDMPGTREGANALHRLQEIDRLMNMPVYTSDDGEPAREEPAVVEPPESPAEVSTPAVKPPEA